MYKINGLGTLLVIVVRNPKASTSIILRIKKEY